MPHQVQQSCIEEGAVGRRLSSVPLLRALDEPTLAALDAELKWVRVPGGQTLFRENDVADALYVVMSGCLGVSVSDGHGGDTLVSRIVAGETVGEMGILDGGRVRGDAHWRVARCCSRCQDVTRSRAIQRHKNRNRDDHPNIADLAPM
jgi:CRP-like cAMP-binding protein